MRKYQRGSGDERTEYAAARGCEGSCNIHRQKRMSISIIVVEGCKSRSSPLLLLAPPQEACHGKGRGRRRRIMKVDDGSPSLVVVEHREQMRD